MVFVSILSFRSVFGPPPIDFIVLLGFMALWLPSHGHPNYPYFSSDIGFFARMSYLHQIIKLLIKKNILNRGHTPTPEGHDGHGGGLGRVVEGINGLSGC